MAVPSRQPSFDSESEVRDEESALSLRRDVSIHSTNPERSVFIEEGNVDGWISTDVTVPLER